MILDKKNIKKVGGKGENPLQDEFFENYMPDPFDYEEFDDFDGKEEGEVSLSDIDFSDFDSSDFKGSLKKLDHKVNVHKSIKSKLKRKKKKNKFASKKNQFKTHKIIVPSDREVIIEGVSKFILSKNLADDSVKKIGYYKGKKLNDLTLIFNNNGLLDFDIELFNPSAINDYNFSNAGVNLNDKITVSNGTTKYTDVLFNILANPTMIISARIEVSGTIPDNVTNQFNQSLRFKNKNIAGLQAIDPLNIQLLKDVYQFQSNIVTFNMMEQLGRPFVPDGMDVIVYKVLAGNTVSMNFYYKQIQIKRMVFEECRKSKLLL